MTCLLKSLPILNLEAIALVPNLKGYERSSHHKLSEINWVSSATETFNEKNIGMSISDNLEQFEAIVEQAKKHGVKTCFSIAVSFGCPYEGQVSKEQVSIHCEKGKSSRC